QGQSKAADQWGYFQAKRIRGTNLETTADLLETLSPPDRVDAAAVQQAAARLAEEFRRAEAETDRLAAALDAARGGLGAAAGPLDEAVKKLRAAAKDRGGQAAAARDRI